LFEAVFPRLCDFFQTLETFSPFFPDIGKSGESGGTMISGCRVSRSWILSHIYSSNVRLNLAQNNSPACAYREGSESAHRVARRLQPLVGFPFSSFPVFLFYPRASSPPDQVRAAAALQLASPNTILPPRISAHQAALNGNIIKSRPYGCRTGTA